MPLLPKKTNADAPPHRPKVFGSDSVTVVLSSQLLSTPTAPMHPFRSLLDTDLHMTLLAPFFEVYDVKPLKSSECCRKVVLGFRFHGSPELFSCSKTIQSGIREI
jgi:hypothetical protein